MAAAALAAALLLYGRNAGWFLPGWIEWKSGVRAVQENRPVGVRIDRRHAVVYTGDDTVWTSPDDILVQDALVRDIDGDDTDEILLLCWKVGRFGVSRPFWVKRDEKSWSQHLFVYEYGPDGVAPQWMSSYMGTDVAEMSVSDSPASGTAGDAAVPAAAGDEPVLLFTSPDGSVSRWFWDSWGFTRLD